MKAVITFLGGFAFSIFIGLLCGAQVGTTSMIAPCIIGLYFGIFCVAMAYIEF